MVDEPTTPTTPTIPETPTVPETPEVPETPTTPETPTVPETPEKKDEFVDDGATPDGEVATPVKKEGEEGEDEEITPEDKDAIGKEVKKAIAPLENVIHNNRIETELNSILAQNPEYKPYEARIRRFVTAPNRSNLIKQGLPVKAVVTEALAPYLQQIGAAKVKAADDKANLTKDIGSSERPAAGAGKLPDFGKMSNKEIEEIGEKVKSGRYKPGE